MSKYLFTVLIGSCARGTGDAYSDIDIVRIGHQRELTQAEIRKLEGNTSTISYIDYDFATFKSLHQNGSLFIHHILTEGKLLSGSSIRWAKFIETFRVTTDLRNEIDEQLRLCRWLARPKVFTKATMPLLSHMFRALKNAAIFSLAQQGVYVYDKREALRSAFQFLDISEIDLLISANNAYVRGASNLNSLPTVDRNALPNLCARVRQATQELLNNGYKTDSHRHQAGNR